MESNEDDGPILGVDSSNRKKVNLSSFGLSPSPVIDFYPPMVISRPTGISLFSYFPTSKSRISLFSGIYQIRKEEPNSEYSARR